MYDSFACLIPAIFLLAEPAKSIAPDWSKVPQIKLVVRPAAEPVPALRVRLLPSSADLHSANAALAYGRLRDEQWTRWLHAKPELYEQMAALSGMRLKELPPRKEWEYLSQLMPEGRIRELRRAALCSYCDWDLHARRREEGPAVNLMHLHGLREVSQQLAFRVRRSLADRNVAEALELVQLHLAMARHAGCAPTLLSPLTGTAIANDALNVLEDCLEQVDCPNLYWALVDVPRPFLDWRGALMADPFLIPSLIDPNVAQRNILTAEQFHELLEAGLAKMKAQQLPVSADFRMLLTAEIAADYATAKSALIQQGRPAAELNQMPMGQVVFLHRHKLRERQLDDCLKWFGLPFGEAEAGLLARTTPSKPSRLYPLDFLDPEMLLRFLTVRENLERRLAALRCIEAIRMHAAAAGSLPESLAEIRCVPVPLDPARLQPFLYQKTSTGFVLRAEPYSRQGREELAKYGKVTPHLALNYEVTMQP